MTTEKKINTYIVECQNTRNVSSACIDLSLTHCRLKIQVYMPLLYQICSMFSGAECLWLLPSHGIFKEFLDLFGILFSLRSLCIHVGFKVFV